MLIQAALLHDTLEDIDTTYQELCNEFGYEVANFVDEISRIGKGKYIANKTSFLSEGALLIKLTVLKEY